MNENDTKQKSLFYSTSDLYFAAYLRALDIPFEGTQDEVNSNANGKNKVIFVFRVQKKSINRLKRDFFGGNGTVKALKYVQYLKSLKQMCYT